ncbi:MAG: OsmC family protein [Chloroflexota bacterium]
MEAKVTWKNEGLLMQGTADTGSVLELASGLDEGAPGFRPMELLAIGLAGCTSMDVLSILKKKRQDVTDFEVRVHTENAEKHPHVWNEARLEYVISGRNIDPKAVERAMDLSKTTYCPAQNMLNQSVEIELSYTIIEVD